MNKQNFFYILLFLMHFHNIYSNNKTLFENPRNSEIKNKTWDPDSLYDYTKENFLSENNPNKSSNLKHMIVDPENYLKNADLSEINHNMKFLYDKFKINNYIFLISHLEIPSYKKNHKEEIDMNNEVERFVSKFNYMMYRDNSFYEDNMTLTIVFFIKDRKMRIRTGRSLREIIRDKDALNILNKRRQDLRKENYYKVVYDIINDVHITYISNYEYYNSFFYKNQTNIIISIIFILISSFIIISYYNYLPESEREKKIKEFLERNKKIKINKVFNESCIICLDKFMPEEEKLKIENFVDKKRLKEEKTYILECGHQFHEKCIIEWVKTQNKCPICRIIIKYDNDNKKLREREFSDNERIGLLNNHNSSSIILDDIISDLINIQRDAYPHQINEGQGKRIISYCKEEKCDNYFTNDYDYDNDKDFKDFNEGSGGATSDW